MEPRPDNDSGDIVFFARREDGYRRSPRLEVQLKCTGTAALSQGEIVYDLPIKNYNDLRDPDRHVAMILVVLCTPCVEPSAGWISESAQSTSLSQAAYWRSLRGEPVVSNRAAKRVRIPVSQQFTTESLTSLMNLIGNENRMP